MKHTEDGKQLIPPGGVLPIIRHHGVGKVAG